MQKQDLFRRTVFAMFIMLVVAMGVPAFAQSESSAGGYGFNGLLTVQVDRTYCGTGGIQCPVFGAAGPTNRNPVRLGIQAANGTTGFTGVPSASFEVVSNLFPAGGSSVVRSTCASCFSEAGSGVYSLFVEPSGAANWRSGAYFVQVKLVTGANTAVRALIKIEIPF